MRRLFSAQHQVAARVGLHEPDDHGAFFEAVHDGDARRLDGQQHIGGAKNGRRVAEFGLGIAGIVKMGRRPGAAFDENARAERFELGGDFRHQRDAGFVGSALLEGRPRRQPCRISPQTLNYGTGLDYLSIVMNRVEARQGAAAGLAGRRHGPRTHVSLSQQILRTDVSGMPLEWVDYREAARFITPSRWPTPAARSLYRLYGGTCARTGSADDRGRQFHHRDARPHR